MQESSAGARGAARDPLLRAAALLPYVGDDLRAVRTATEVVDGLAHDVLPRLVDTSAALRPAALRPEGDRIALAPLLEARPALVAASSAASTAADRLDGVRLEGLLGPVRNGVLDAQRSVRDLAALTRDGAHAARLLPPMLGGEGRRRYFLAFQNNAEARGTGGLLGAYGVLEAERGRLRLLRLGPNTDLEPLDRMPLDLGPDFADLYGADPALWVNANMSPHFPYAARLWLEMWRRQTGERLDGVIATDPVALSLVLRATGPVALPGGQQVTAGNAVALTLRDVYARYPRSGDNPVRDRYLQGIAASVVEALLSGQGEPRAIAGALGQAAGQRRLLVWSRVPAEAAGLAETPLGGVLDGTPGPFGAVVVNNAAGSKLDYYLARDVRYTARACGAQRRRSRLEIDLTNTAPARDLPRYVTLRVDRGRLTQGIVGRPGTNVLLVNVYAAAGAHFTGGRLDGRDLFVGQHRERGHPVYTFTVSIEPGQTRRAALEFSEPAVGGRARTIEQPLVQGQRTRMEAVTCS